MLNIKRCKHKPTQHSEWGTRLHMRHTLNEYGFPFLSVPDCIQLVCPKNSESCGPFGSDRTGVKAQALNKTYKFIATI